MDEVRAELRPDKVRAAISNRDTGPVFDWLIAAISYQGISNEVAEQYMEKHGRARWRQIKQGIDRATCPKMRSYWHFHDCRFDKISRTCAKPDHIRRCPLPNHDLRNGRLNQTAYSLFLFIRDVTTIFCIALASCIGSMRSTPMGWLAIGPAAAPTLFKPSPSILMPGSSTRHFRTSSPGSFNTRSGSTVV